MRRTGNESGPTLHFLDTTPLADQLERALHAIRQTDIGEPGAAAAVNMQRIAILEKVRPVVAPNLHGDLRRSPRLPVTVAAKVRVGLARICHELAPKGLVEPANDADAGNEQIEVFAVADSPRARRRHVPDEHDSLAASIVPVGDQAWQVKDRSVAGLRIAASGGIGQSLVLGALVAVRQTDSAEWVLGAVRRLNKVSNDEVEAGVSIIADRVVPITVNARRAAKEDLGMVVNGVDVSTMGSRFDALYLPPPSRPEKPLAVKTVIVPDVRIRGRAQPHPDDRALGLHDRASPSGRAARRLELGGVSDHRQEAHGLLIRRRAGRVSEDDRAVRLLSANLAGGI